MSRYYHVVDAAQVDISEAGVLPLSLQWMGDRWVYLSSHGILWPRSGDWIVTDHIGRAAVLRDEEFQRVYFPCPNDAMGCRERWVGSDAQGRAQVHTAESTGHTARAHAGSADAAAMPRPR
jgi:hypothetical protein